MKEEVIDQNELIKNFMELSEKKMRNQHMLKQKEIDLLIQQNTTNMNNTLFEIRNSYEKDIAEIDEEMFGEIIQSMKDEMETELENIRIQYDKERKDGIDKINNKYKI
jgi:hypothetical protein